MRRTSARTKVIVRLEKVSRRTGRAARPTLVQRLLPLEHGAEEGERVGDVRHCLLRCPQEDVAVDEVVVVVVVVEQLLEVHRRLPGLLQSNEEQPGLVWHVHHDQAHGEKGVGEEVELLALHPVPLALAAHRVQAGPGQGAACSAPAWRATGGCLLVIGRLLEIGYQIGYQIGDQADPQFPN